MKIVAQLNHGIKHALTGLISGMVVDRLNLTIGVDEDEKIRGDSVNLVFRSHEN